MILRALLVNLLFVVISFAQTTIQTNTTQDLNFLLENLKNLDEVTNQSYESTNVLTLQDAIDLALQNNTQIAQSLKDLESAKASYTGSIQDFYVPNLSVGASMSLIDTFPDISPQLAAQLGAKTGPRLNFSAPTISLSKTLFNGLSTMYSHRIAKEDYLNTQNTYSNLVRSVVSETVTRYYTQFLQEEEMNVVLERLKQLQDQVTQAQINYRNGRVSDYDVSLAQGQFYGAQPAFYTAERSRLFAREDFYRFIGYAPKEKELLQLQGDLLSLTNIQFSDLDIEVALNYILSNDTQLATLRTANRNATNQKGQQNSVRLPKLDFRFDFNPNYGNNFNIDNFTQDEYNGSYGITLALRIPILEWIPGTSAASRVKVAQKNIEKTKLNLLNAEEERILALKNLLLQIQELSQSLNSLRQAESNAQRAAIIANNQYQNGRIPLTDLNNAQLSYINAKRDLLNAVYNEFSAKLGLQEASNNLTEFLDLVQHLNTENKK